MKLGPAATVLVVLLVGEQRAFAADRAAAHLRYELEDPQNRCASEATFRARVASRIGYDPFRDDAPMDLRVRFVATEKMVRAEITSTEPGKPPGKRVLDDPKCEPLGDAVASAVALLLDPVSATSGPPPPEAPPRVEPAPAVTPEVNEDRPPPPPPPTEPAVATIPALYGDLTVAFGRTPGWLVGGRVGAGLRRGVFSIALEGHAQSTVASAAIATHDRVDATALSGALVPCGHVGKLFVCGAATVGSRQVRALDVAQPETKSALFAAIGARGGVEMPLSAGLAFRAHVELGIPLVRTTYATDGIARTTTPVVEGGLGVGLIGLFR